MKMASYGAASRDVNSKTYPVRVLYGLRMRIPLKHHLASLSVNALSQVLDWERSRGHVTTGRPARHAPGERLHIHLVCLARDKILCELRLQWRPAQHYSWILTLQIHGDLVPGQTQNICCSIGQLFSQSVL